MTLNTTSFPANIPFDAGNQNQTNDSSCKDKNLNWKFTFVPVYIVLISVLGIVLNVFVLMIFWLHKKAWTTADVYLSNLAAADLVVAFFRLFWAAYMLNDYKWIFGQAMCKIVHASILMNAYCSIYIVVLISIDRYLALVHPMSIRKIRRPKYAKLACLLVWILGFLFCIPELIYRNLTNYKCNTNYQNITVHLTIGMSTSVFAFIVPFFIISFCTLKIFKALKSKLTVRMNTKKTDQKAISLVLAVLLAFLICWIPYHMIRITSMLLQVKYLTGCNWYNILHIGGKISVCFALFSSVLNPILYVAVGKNFRKKVIESFRQLNHNRDPTVSSHCDPQNRGEDDALTCK